MKEKVTMKIRIDDQRKVKKVSNRKKKAMMILAHRPDERSWITYPDTLSELHRGGLRVESASQAKDVDM
jgi:hypothetical protein